MVTTALSVWLKFAFCVLLIGVAGTNLSRYGDAIAAKTGLSRSWMGLVLLATVTSLPELISGISAVTLTEAPDLAVGGVIGSCVFNLAILVLLDGLCRGEPIYVQASREHLVSAGFGVLLIGLAAVSMIMSARGGEAAFAHIGVSSPIIIAVYALAMYTMFRYGQGESGAEAPSADEPYAAISMGQVVVRYVVAALVIVGAGTWLPFVGVEIAQIMGWQDTFVGTFFLAFATSVPELVVTLAALRLGAIDLAMGNILGSNLFNIATLPVNDLFYFAGPLLANISRLHRVSSLSAILMTGLVIAGLLSRPKAWPRKTVTWTSWLILGLYIVTTYILYTNMGGS